MDFSLGLTHFPSIHNISLLITKEIIRVNFSLKNVTNIVSSSTINANSTFYSAISYQTSTSSIVTVVVFRLNIIIKDVTNTKPMKNDKRWIRFFKPDYLISNYLEVYLLGSIIDQHINLQFVLFHFILHSIRSIEIP